MAAFAKTKASLIDIARKQLDEIGITAGYLPAEHPFSMSLPESLSLPEYIPVEPQAEISKRVTVLSEAVKSVSSFDALYVQWSEKAHAAFLAAGRARSAQRVQGSLAALAQ